MIDIVPLPAEYAAWLAELKARIHAAQQRAALAVNRELVLLYWQIGRDILDRQGREGWGAKVIERLEQDLRNAFPDMKGFSPRNLKYMRAFAEAWPDAEFVQGVLAQLPWYHHLALLDKLRTEDERRWYAAKAIEHGWSRNVLVIQIETRLRERSGQAVTNFAERLPAPMSDLARESLKDPYWLDFLGLGEEAQERSLEDAIVQHITRFLLELGAGFAFVGRQAHIEVGGDDFFIDLLFYHLKLRCCVVVELKAGAFKPEHAGQLSFYLSAVDAQMKSDHDGPTVGLLLCKSKDKVVAEYAFRDSSKPIGVAEYLLIEALPADLQTSLPSIEAIERALATDAGSEKPHETPRRHGRPVSRKTFPDPMLTAFRHQPPAGLRDWRQARHRRRTIVSPFFAKPEMGPSDFRSKKSATSDCLRRPAFVLRPPRLRTPLRSALRQRLPQMTLRRVGGRRVGFASARAPTPPKPAALRLRGGRRTPLVR